MGKGIAVLFKQKFGGLSELEAQHRKVRTHRKPLHLRTSFMEPSTPKHRALHVRKTHHSNKRHRSAALTQHTLALTCPRSARWPFYAAALASFTTSSPSPSTSTSRRTMHSGALSSSCGTTPPPTVWRGSPCRGAPPGSSASLCVVCRVCVVCLCVRTMSGWCVQ